MPNARLSFLKKSVKNENCSQLKLHNKFKDVSWSFKHIFSDEGSQPELLFKCDVKYSNVSIFKFCFVDTVEWNTWSYFEVTLLNDSSIFVVYSLKLLQSILLFKTQHFRFIHQQDFPLKSSKNIRTTRKRFRTIRLRNHFKFLP